VRKNPASDGIKGGGANQESPLLEKRLGGNRISGLLSHELTVRSWPDQADLAVCLDSDNLRSTTIFWHFDAVRGRLFDALWLSV
jgi:hypothetical protein